jgi:hypothetical protein
VCCTIIRIHFVYISKILGTVRQGISRGPPPSYEDAVDPNGKFVFEWCHDTRHNREHINPLHNKMTTSKMTLYIKIVSITTLNKSRCYSYSEKSLGLSPDNLFQLGVIYKSYRQVLTPVDNSQFLLKLAILDKLRLATFHKL